MSTRGHSYDLFASPEENREKDTAEDAQKYQAGDQNKTHITWNSIDEGG